MKVLIACEFSGIVREAFRELGHDAWSCDLLPTEIPGKHIQGDVLDWLYDTWDLMIAHPPCTFLTVAANRWYKENPQRYLDRIEAATFFIKLALANIPKIVIENPIGVMSGFYRKPDQIIQPWQFGHPESKATCLWLKNLPLLKPTNILPLRKIWENQTPSGQNKLGPSEDRWKDRSRSYKGIAEALASQYGT
jgi:hypothetical protein